MAMAADIPLFLALPAAASIIAYVNARFGVYGDLATIGNLASASAASSRKEKEDRINFFYVLEDHALDPKVASRACLATATLDRKPGEQTEWTYREAYDTVLKYAEWLNSSFCIGKNEIVAMDFTNKPQFVWIWLALWSLGARPAFINTNLRGKAFVHSVRTSGSPLVLVDPDVAEVLDNEARSDLQHPDGKGKAVDCVVVDAQMQQEILALAGFRAPNEARSGPKIKDPGMLIYTSGTTGLPKAANVPWTKVRTGGGYVARLLNLKSQDRIFTAMPLYHGTAALLGFCSSMIAGCTLIISPKFSPRTFIQQASESGATVILYVGEMCRYLITSPPTPYDQKHNIRAAFGNGMRLDVWQKFKDRFNIPTVAEFYGGSESPVSSFNLSNNDFARGAVGRKGALMSVLLDTYAIVRNNPDTDEPLRDSKSNFCTRVNANEPGELLSKVDAANLTDTYQGYYGNEKASQSKIIRSAFKRDDAWYRTGDLIRRDSDGRWWFVDRIGDTFRWKGENVSTAEVSEALGAHPAIEETNVYGVQLPGHDGRAGCAAVVLADGKTLDGGLARELAGHVRRSLPRYAVPIFLRVVLEVEVTGNMKQTKTVLRNEGADPGKTAGDAVFWLAPSGESYQAFGKTDWEGLVGGRIKL